MSADNWRVCRKCLLAAQAKYRAAEQDLAKAYGKVPVEEFDAKRAALGDEPTISNQEENLREDYEFYLSTAGEFSAAYSAHCSACGFGHTFKHEEKVSLE